MSTVNKPKRALLAYCALADRLQQSNANLMQALTPFFAPVCSALAGQMFDAAKFCDEVAARYGLRIPRLAALGLSEQLEREGLLESVSGKASKTVYQYVASAPALPDEAVPVTEAEIDKVLAEFVQVCRQDDLLSGEQDQVLHEAFLERLLNTDSMRLLSRREASAATKRGAGTLTLKAAATQPEDQRELRLDFHVSQFLVDLRTERPALFDRVSDIAFANMAAEALACFSEAPSNGSPLDSLAIYLDSPLLLDVLGVNADYADYGNELLDLIKQSGATAAVFDDAVNEAESVIAAQNAALRSGISQRGAHWGTSAKPHILAALMNNVAERAQSKGITIHRDPEIDLIKKARGAVGDIQAEMTKRMAGWPTQEARQHDERSVWSMLRIRDASSMCPKIQDSKAVFIARNTSLVRIANDCWRLWLQNGVRHSRHVIERWAPVAMSDKQLAGYLWLRQGSGNGQMSKARLLAHCSAAIRPRPDVKARAYNLILDLEGKDAAEHIAALLEDREGERALMRATRGDPEDVTRERLPFIIEQVKLAAGEFAAAVVREELQTELATAKAVHEAELQRVNESKNDEVKKASDEATAVRQALEAERLERGHLDGRVASLARQLALTEFNRRHAELKRIEGAYEFGLRAYRRLRGLLVALFACLSLLAFTSLNDWPYFLQLLGTVGLSTLGFWFVPDVLEGFVRWHGIRELHKEAQRKDVGPLIPSEAPAFHARTWQALANLKLEHENTNPGALA
jgi:hypothetical protein